MTTGDDEATTYSHRVKGNLFLPALHALTPEHALQQPE